MDARMTVLLQAVWDLTTSKGGWPSFQALDRRLWREHELEAGPLIAAIGQTLVLGGQRMGGAAPDPKGEVSLTVLGLASCEGSEAVLGCVVRALQAAVIADKTAPNDSEPQVTADQAVDGASDGTSPAKTPRAAQLAQLSGLVLANEPWLSQISRYQGGWRIMVDGRVRSYRDVDSVPSFLARRERELRAKVASPRSWVDPTPQSKNADGAAHASTPDPGRSPRGPEKDTSNAHPGKTGSLRTVALTALVTALISAPVGAVATNGTTRLVEAISNARSMESERVLDYISPDGLRDDGTLNVVGDQLAVSGKLLQPLPRGRVLYTASRITTAGSSSRLNDGFVGYSELPCNIDEVAETFSCDPRSLGASDDAGQRFYVWLIMPDANQLRQIIERRRDQDRTGNLQDPPGPVWVSPTYEYLKQE